MSANNIPSMAARSMASRLYSAAYDLRKASNTLKLVQAEAEKIGQGDLAAEIEKEILPIRLTANRAEHWGNWMYPAYPGGTQTIDEAKGDQCES